MAKYELKPGSTIFLQDPDNPAGKGLRHSWEDGPVELKKADAKHFYQHLRPYIGDDDEDEDSAPEPVAAAPKPRSDVTAAAPKPTRRRRGVNDAASVSDPA